MNKTFQITLFHSQDTRSYLYLTVNEEIKRDKLEELVQDEYTKDYIKEIESPRLFHSYYTVRNTVKVKEWDLEKDRAVRKGLKFSLYCVK